MRTTTLLNRLPYLPKADAYCSEAGGRIFYPTEQLKEACFTVEPKSFQGATNADLKPFGIVEDMEWRQQVEEYTGKFDMDGSSFPDLKSFVSTPVQDRESSNLWDFARDLEKKGYVVDIKGYSSCFRLNKKHQTQISDEDFYRLVDKEALKKAGLDTSVNLSCIDIYPVMSGKKNCCQYLGEKLFPDVPKDFILSKNSVCLCDDDNDIEMASAVRHAFIPSLHSKTMEQVIQKNQEHFTETYKRDSSGSGTGASDLALRLILEGGV
jgi:hydroxymethylpyrimidine pyrophosphatase-like HAD family hydrolase